MTCKWLPEFYDEPDWNDFQSFENKLYEVFRALYLDSQILFNEIIVKYRFKPYVNNREEVFYHLTCKDYEEEGLRSPDPDRIVRIKWTKAFIENHICNEVCCDLKPLYWTKEYGKNQRHKIFYQDFLVILEERENYFLLITGYYVQEAHYRRGLEKEYAKCT